MKLIRTIAEKKKIVSAYQRIKPFQCLLIMYGFMIVFAIAIRSYGMPAFYVIMLFLSLIVTGMIFAFRRFIRNGR